MKNRILTFIIGILVGCIITTFCFLMYTKINYKNIPNDFDRGNINNQMRPNDFNMNEPPQKPNGNNHMNQE